MITGVYLIKNKLTGDCYVGSSIKSIEDRWRYHRRDLNGNKHHSSRLQNSWNKYGSEQFEFSIVEECSPVLCIEREQHFIDTLNPSFNMNPTAGNCFGRKFSSESKQKMSESAKKRGLNDFLLNQQKSKAIFNNIGEKQCTKCTIFKNPNIFRKNTNCCLECYAETRPSRKLKNPKGRKPVVARNNFEVLEFNTMIDAETFFKNRGFKMNRTYLRSVLKTNKEYYGYTWSFKCL